MLKKSLRWISIDSLCANCLLLAPRRLFNTGLEYFSYSSLKCVSKYSRYFFLSQFLLSFSFPHTSLQSWLPAIVINLSLWCLNLSPYHSKDNFVAEYSKRDHKGSSWWITWKYIDDLSLKPLLFTSIHYKISRPQNKLILIIHFHVTLGEDEKLEP